jgi:hypothetical protein
MAHNRRQPLITLKVRFGSLATEPSRASFGLCLLLLQQRTNFAARLLLLQGLAVTYVAL